MVALSGRRIAATSIAGPPRISSANSVYQLAMNRAVAAKGLQKRDIMVGGRRTSMKMDDANWNALLTVARKEGVTVDMIATEIDRRKAGGQTLTSAMRVFIASYLSMTSK